MYGKSILPQAEMVRYLKHPGDPNLFPALRLQVPDLKGCRFQNHLRTFHLFSSEAVTKVEFLETRASQSRNGKSIRHQNRPPGKETRPKTRLGGGEVAPRCVAPGERVREKLRAKGYTRYFLCLPVLGSAPNCVAPQETHGRLSARLAALLLHSQNGPCDLTYYPPIVCAGERGRRRASGAPPEWAGGKKTGRHASIRDARLSHFGDRLRRCPAT